MGTFSRISLYSTGEVLVAFSKMNFTTDFSLSRCISQSFLKIGYDLVARLVFDG